LLRQKRRLVGIQLHVKGGQQRCGPGVIAHQRNEIDQGLGAKVLQSPGKGPRRNFPFTEDLATEFDNDRIGRVEAVRVEPMLNDFDDIAGDAFAERLGFMRCPFELTIELAGRDRMASSRTRPPSPASYRR